MLAGYGVNTLLFIFFSPFYDHRVSGMCQMNPQRLLLEVGSKPFPAFVLWRLWYVPGRPPGLCGESPVSTFGVEGKQAYHAYQARENRGKL